MVETPVIFLDEFSTGMDPILKRAVMELLRAESKRGRTIVLTTQVLSEAEELCVSDIGVKFKIPPTTLSFHLKELTQARLIKARQDGRFVYYSADFKAMNTLLRYLTEHCCEGQPCDVNVQAVECQEE